MKPGQNLADVQLKNRSTILKLLRAHKSVCRKDLADLSGLSAATVTNLVRDLIDIGLVRESDDYRGRSGRNAISLETNGDAFLVLGASFRRGRLACAVSDLNGHIVTQTTTELPTDVSVEVVLKEIGRSFEPLLSAQEVGGKVVGLGVALPGPVNLSQGRITQITNLPGWKQVPIKRLFEERFGVSVLIEHDANAAVLAEKWFGVGKPYQNIVSLLVGKGIGAGIIVHDRVYRGTSGFAGEIGHASINFDGPPCECGNRGCLEYYASTLSILIRAAQRLDRERGLTIVEFQGLLEAGNAEARSTLLEAATYLGYGVVNVVNSFNPEVIVLGGEISLLGEKWLRAIRDRVREVVDARVLPEIAASVRIEHSRLGHDSVLLGTVALVVDHLFDSPDLSYLKAVRQGRASAQ